MPAIGTQVFSGLKPKLANHLLDDANATTAQNCYLVDGYLRPLKGRAQERTWTGSPLTVYKYENTSSWLQWNTRVHVAKSVNPNLNRLYYSGAGEPRVGDPTSDMVSGAGPYPNVTYKLGLPKPLNAPTVAVTVDQPDPETDYTSLDLETRYYVVTYVAKWAPEEIESASSPVSLAVSCYPDSHCTVTLPGAPVSSGYYPPTHKRIYRSNTGTQSTNYQFVAEVAVATATFLDTLDSASLSEVAETLLWEIPPVALTSLTTVGGEFYAGLNGSDVCFSEVRVAYAWPLSYRFPVDDKPVGIAANGNDLVVLTVGRPVVFVGNTPEAMQQIRLSEFQPCMSEPSIVVFGGMVCYAGADGLIGVSSSQGFVNLTEKILTRDVWQGMSPSTMKIVVWERYLYITSSVGNWLLDLAEESFWPITLKYDAAYYDGYSDTLFVSEGSTLYRFGEGSNLTYIWQSKLYPAPQISLAVAKVINSASYPNTIFEYLVDGTMIYRRKLTSSQPFRLPARRASNVMYRLTGTDVIRTVSLANSPQELMP